MFRPMSRPMLIAMPTLTLPKELVAIFRFIHIFETIFDSPTTCASINNTERYPSAKNFIEATFVVVPRNVAAKVLVNGQPTLKASFQVPLLGRLETVLAEYIDNATQNSNNISTRIYFLLSLRIILTRILIKLAVMENADPYCIHVRTAKAEWIIDPANCVDPLPQLLALATIEG